MLFLQKALSYTFDLVLNTTMCYNVFDPYTELCKVGDLE